MKIRESAMPEQGMWESFFNPSEIVSKLGINNNTANVQGSGLGLPIALAIIEKHRGNISVKSTVGVGTTFTISIPLGQIPE